MPIYRCWSGRGNFVSNFGDREGQRVEGLYGYLAPTAAEGAPVYRLLNDQSGDHLATFLKDEGTGAGYHPEGTLGFAQ